MRAVDRTDWALSLEFGGGAQQNGAVACWHGRSVEISRVEARDVGSVLAVLDEVAERLDSKGVRQWPRRFQPSWVTPAIEEGHTWLVHLDGELAATTTLEWADPMWGPDDGSAGYVHRLACVGVRLASACTYCAGRLRRSANVSGLCSASTASQAILCSAPTTSLPAFSTGGTWK